MGPPSDLALAVAVGDPLNHLDAVRRVLDVEEESSHLGGPHIHGMAAEGVLAIQAGEVSMVASPLDLALAVAVGDPLNHPDALSNRYQVGDRAHDEYRVYREYLAQTAPDPRPAADLHNSGIESRLDLPLAALIDLGFLVVESTYLQTGMLHRFG